MKSFIFAANWKMYKNPMQSESYFRSLREKTLPTEHQYQFFVSFVNLHSSLQGTLGTGWKIGAQNCYFESVGAFTGETSPQTLKEIGCHAVLIGHSERRQLFAETNELVAKKLSATQGLGLETMLCVGETWQERQNNQTETVLENQLKVGLAKADWSRPLILAYEPVWAIGTGQVATPEQANQTHGQIRYVLKQNFGEKASHTKILYGGSVKAENSKSLKAMAEIDGFLIGGASLDVDSFRAIVTA